MHGRRCSPITQTVIADRPKFLTCFGIIAVKGIPLYTGNQQVVTQSQRARSPFSLSPAFIFPKLFARSGFKSTKPLSGSRIDHSFTGHQSVNKGRQAIYGQLLFPTQFTGFGINGIQKALGILGKHDATINCNGVFNRITNRTTPKNCTVLPIQSIHMACTFQILIHRGNNYFSLVYQWRSHIKISSDIVSPCQLQRQIQWSGNGGGMFRIA